MPSYIQDLRPDSVPCKHPHWAAGQKSAPSVSLPGWADVSPVQGIHRLCPQGTFSALPSLCWSEPFTPRNGMSALPLQNKGEYESFPLRTKPNCIAMHFVTSVFLSTPEACSSPCSQLASKTLHPSPAALSLESTIQGVLLWILLISDRGSTRLWFQSPSPPPHPARNFVSRKFIYKLKWNHSFYFRHLLGPRF